MAVLEPQKQRIVAETNKAFRLASTLSTIEGLSRQYVAELLVVRLFSLFEEITEEAACKIVCGANYCDGTTPALQRARPTRGLESARKAMSEYGRGADTRNILRWNKAGEIKENLACLVPATEHFISTMNGHGNFISELRKVRNHIAHRNRGTAKKFQHVVRHRYGANVNSMTPGKMLLSSRFRPILIEQYTRSVRIVLLAAIKG